MGLSNGGAIAHLRVSRVVPSTFKEYFISDIEVSRSLFVWQEHRI